MEPLGRSLLVIAALVALAASPAPRLSVSVRPKPTALEAGAAWQPVIRIRRGGRPLVGARPAVVISKAGARRSFAARSMGRGLYRARVVFPSAGRWAYSVRLGKRTFRLGSAAVRAPAVRLVAAGDVVVDADGSLVVADVLGNQVVRLTGTRLTRLARLEFPVEVALDPGGGIAVVTEERRVQHISAGGVRTIAGTTTPGFSGDGGPATAAQLDQPTSITYDARGNLFITELGGRIRRVDAATGTISTFAGVGGQGFGGDGGPAVRAQLDRPHGLAVGPDGTVYFGDTFNNRVRKVAPDGTISTVAAGLSTPNDVTLGADGALYATDYGSNRIVQIDPGGVVSSVATADGPNSVALGADRAIYATERTNAWVLRVDPATGAVTRLPGR
jgi:sugar lactone lactonase YvrE